MERIIYVDHSATTFTKNEVIEEMLPYFDKKYGNASSSHKFGQITKKAIESSRERIAKILNVDKGEVYFTSGGSESDNMIILGVARANRFKGNHIITTKIEHKAVLNACHELEKEGFEVTYLDVDKNGFVSTESIRKAIKDTTILVSIMLANNEIGTIEPIEEISKITRFKGIILHTDAVQAIGNVKVDVKELGVDALSISGHKFYGPKGIGIAVIKKNVKFSPLIFGGHQENEKRAGTENVPGIVGICKALELATKDMDNHSKHLKNLREYTITRILSELNNVKINGDRLKRLPGNVNVSFKGIDSRLLLLMLDLKGIEASIGSACNSENTTVSHVLKAIGLEEEYINGSLRITYGDDNTKEDAIFIVDSIVQIVNKIRNKM